MLVLTVACPKPIAAPSPTPPPTTGNTITITALGASPRNSVIPLGSQVTFINNDSVAHEMYSTASGTHRCPEIRFRRTLPPERTRQTKNLTVARRRLHDHIILLWRH